MANEEKDELSQSDESTPWEGVDRDPPAIQRISSPVRAWRWCKRNPVAAGFWSVIVLLVLTFSIGGPLVAIHQAALRIQAHRESYVIQMNIAQRDWEAGEIELLLKRLEQTRPKSTGDDDLRGFEWYYWWHVTRPYQMASGENHGVKLRNVRRANAEEMLYDEGYVGSVAFSPDNKTLATFSSKKELKLWDIASGRVLTTIEGAQGRIVSLGFSASGKALFSASADGPITRWNLSTGEPEHSFKVHDKEIDLSGIEHVYNPAKVQTLAFSPDGQTLVSYGHLESVEWERTPGAGIGISPKQDRMTKIWDATTGKPRTTLNGYGYSGFLTFSADGKTLALGGQGWIGIFDLDGHCLAYHRETRLDVSVAALSPDGNTLAAGGDDGAIQLLDPITGKPKNALFGHTAAISWLAFCPDGKTLASAGSDATVRLWNVPTGQLTTTFKKEASRVVFSPDGKMLVSTGKNAQLWLAATEDDVIADRYRR